MSLSCLAFISSRVVLSPAVILRRIHWKRRRKSGRKL